MKDEDVLRVIGATVLAAAVAVLTQDEPHDPLQVTAVGFSQTEEVKTIDRGQFNDH